MKLWAYGEPFRKIVRCNVCDCMYRTYAAAPDRCNDCWRDRGKQELGEFLSDLRQFRQRSVERRAQAN